MGTRLQVLQAQADAEEEGIRVQSFRSKEEAKNSLELARVQALLQAGITTEQFARWATAKEFLSAMVQSKDTKLVAVPPGLMGLDWSKTPHAAAVNAQTGG